MHRLNAEHTGQDIDTINLSGGLLFLFVASYTLP